MIKYTKYLLLFILFSNCKGQDDVEKMENGEWEQITISKKDTIIFNPCRSENRKIIIRNDSLIDHTGQEIISCKIKSTFSQKNLLYIILENNCSYSDTLSYKRISKNIIQWNLYNGVKFYATSIRKKYKKVNEKCDNKEGKQTDEVASDKKDIILYRVLKEGVNAQNIVSQQTKTLIESIIGEYTTMEDYGTDQFYKRESSKINNYKITHENIKIWNLCFEKLNFEDVADKNELESDWRYPYNKLNFSKKILSLYDDTDYGDSWQHIASTPKYHIALYMYFLSLKERKLAYEEIDALKKEMQKNENK